MKHMLSLRVPEHHQLKRGLCWDQSQQGIHRGRGLCDRRRSSGCICRMCAAAMWGHVGTEMITAATVRVKSQTGRICSLNLITGTHADRKTSTHSVCLCRPMSSDQHCGGETVAGSKLNNPKSFLSCESANGGFNEWNIYLAKVL